MKHYIVRADGVVQSYEISYKVFKRDYEPAVPHRPLWAARLFAKRVRLYRRIPTWWVKVTVYYEGERKGRSIHVDAGVVMGCLERDIDITKVRAMEHLKDVLADCKKYCKVKGCINLPRSYWIGDNLVLNELILAASKEDFDSEADAKLGTPLTMRVGVAVEDDGSPEEWCEVWRV